MRIFKLFTTLALAASSRDKKKTKLTPRSGLLNNPEDVNGKNFNNERSYGSP